VVLGSLLLASASLAACDNHGEDSADLQAILHDGDLTEVMRSALMAAPAPGMGTGGAGGSMMPPAAGGSGGSMVPPPPPSGSAGAMMVPPPPSGSAGSMVVPPPPPGPGTAGTVGTMTGSAGTTGTAGKGPPPGPGTAGFGGSMGGPPPRNLPGQAQGFWRFDDCNMNRTDLVDSSFFGNHTAFRSVTAFCRPGILNSGIGFDEDDDVVIVPDQPNFVFSEGFTVAAWVKPVAFGGFRTIFRKRQDGTSTFVLGENGKNFQVVISLANGKAADVQAPATLDTFTHVAATYDGIFLKLYLNGVEAASKRVVGRLSDGVGPLLMGNDANKRRIDGILDSVVFDVLPFGPADIMKLTCLPSPSVMSVTPTDPAAVPPGTPVNYDVQITNNSCEDANFDFNANAFDPSLQLNPNSGFSFVLAGTTAHLPFSVSATDDTVQFGTTQINVNAELFSQSDFEPFFQTVNFSDFDNSTPCTVKARKELEIRDVTVVDDPIRTGPGGAWTFGKLMEDMAPTPADAPAMVEAMFNSFLSQQTVNTFTLPPRTGVQQVLDSMRGPDGKLDLSLSFKTFRLLAIANRIDLNDATDTSATTAGEGRFVFGFTPFGGFRSATVIVEYSIPASSKQDVVDLANAWHALKMPLFPSEDFNAALQAVTERFTKRGAAPARTNGSALGQIRTNDFFSFGGAWEFREFHLDPMSGMLVPAPMALTPDRSFNNSPLLGQFVMANEPAILAEKHTVPLMFQGVPFQGGNVDASDFFTWGVPGAAPETRHRFARNTCNGCHTGSETGANQFQIQPRFPGQESQLSGFLLGADVPDFSAGVIRHFHELSRRGRILHDLVCPQEMLPPPPPDTTPIDTGTGGAGGGFPPPPGDGGFSGAGGMIGGFDGGAATGTAGAPGK
jgi:hypothetical protein